MGESEVVNENGDDSYNLTLQGVGILVVVLASALGVGLGHVLQKLAGTADLKQQKRFVRAVLFGKSIGCGVIVATACIHLINEAQGNFEAAGWNESYEAWPWVFALAGIYLAAFFTVIAHHDHEQQEDASEQAVDPGNKPEEQQLDELQLMDNTHHAPPATLKQTSPCSRLEGNEIAGTSSARTQAIAMEASVVIHSILIGFDLGLQEQSSWTPLVVAICFHQFFEGFALAQVLAEARFTKRWFNLFMAILFSLTTAVGIAIGMITYTTYDNESISMDILIGILDSFCGGVLLFIGFQLLFTWFVHNPVLLNTPDRSWTMIIFAGIGIGMMIMATIAIWA